MQVGSYITVETQLEKAEVGPASGVFLTWDAMPTLVHGPEGVLRLAMGSRVIQTTLSIFCIENHY